MKQINEFEQLTRWFDGRLAALRRLGVENERCLCGEIELPCLQADHTERRAYSAVCWGLCVNCHARITMRQLREQPPIHIYDPYRWVGHALLGASEYLDLGGDWLGQFADRIAAITPSSRIRDLYEAVTRTSGPIAAAGGDLRPITLHLRERAELVFKSVGVELIDDRERHRRRLVARQEALHRLRVHSITCVCQETNPICFDPWSVEKRARAEVHFGTCKSCVRRINLSPSNAFPNIEVYDPVRRVHNGLLGIADYLDFAPARLELVRQVLDAMPGTRDFGGDFNDIAGEMRLVASGLRLLTVPMSTLASAKIVVRL